MNKFHGFARHLPLVSFTLPLFACDPAVQGEQDIVSSVLPFAVVGDGDGDGDGNRDPNLIENPDLARLSTPDVWIGTKLGLREPPFRTTTTGAHMPFLPRELRARFLAQAEIEGYGRPSHTVVDPGLVEGTPPGLSSDDTARSDAHPDGHPTLSAAPGDPAKGVSGNDDTRDCFAPTSTAQCVTSSGFPFNVIGKFSTSGVCTGTQVGPVHVLTAAHCVWPQGNACPNTTTQWFPGYSNGAASVGSTGIERIYVPTEWANNDPDAGLFDYALLIVDSRLVNQWVGVGHISDANLQSEDLYNRGYPGQTDDVCTSWSPDSTLWSGGGANRLFGDASTRRIQANKFRAPDPDSNEERIFVTAHDTSNGHSGGPYYSYETNGPVIWGIHRSPCTPSLGGDDAFCEFDGTTFECTDTVVYNSQAIRIEPTSLSNILTWKSLWGVDANGDADCLVSDCGGETPGCL